MSNEDRIRRLIRGSIQRAIQESVAGLFVLAAFTGILLQSDVGSFQYFGCLLIIVGIGFIGGVVWSYALSFRLLSSHPANDLGFWREAFHAQAKLLRWVPAWYCGPIFTAAILFCLPIATYEIVPFLMLLALFAAMFVFVVWLNRNAARQIEQDAASLAA